MSHALQYCPLVLPDEFTNKNNPNVIGEQRMIERDGSTRPLRTGRTPSETEHQKDGTNDSIGSIAIFRCFQHRSSIKRSRSALLRSSALRYNDDVFRIFRVFWKYSLSYSEICRSKLLFNIKQIKIKERNYCMRKIGNSSVELILYPRLAS